MLLFAPYVSHFSDWEELVALATELLEGVTIAARNFRLQEDEKNPKEEIVLSVVVHRNVNKVLR